MLTGSVDHVGFYHDVFIQKIGTVYVIGQDPSYFCRGKKNITGCFFFKKLVH